MKQGSGEENLSPKSLKEGSASSTLGRAPCCQIRGLLSLPFFPPLMHTYLTDAPLHDLYADMMVLVNWGCTRVPEERGADMLPEVLLVVLWLRIHKVLDLRIGHGGGGDLVAVAISSMQ